MTVCIAAICEGGKKVVVAADRMFTAGAPVNVEFETGERKIERLSHSCMALSAGNSAYAYEIIKAATVALAGREIAPMESVVELMRDAYVVVRGTKVKETILAPVLGPDYFKNEQAGMSLPQYMASQQGMYQQITMMMGQFNLGTDIIVAGVVNDSARLAVITNPGTVLWVDKLGHATIGSGGIHAMTRLALGAQTKNASLEVTLYQVFEAKKAAEVAPGVGSATDIAIVSSDDTRYCAEPVLQSLSEIFAGAGGRKPDNLDKLSEALKVGQ